MKISRALLTFIFVACPIAGHSADGVKEVSYKNMIRLNSTNVSKIATGMTKDEVLQIMGNIRSKVRDGPIDNPWKIEIHGEMEVLYYITAGHPPFIPIRASQTTPVVLNEGKVIGMGSGLLKQIEATASMKLEKPSVKPSIEERLNTLKELYDNGVIDKDTYEAQKTRILDSI